MKYRLQQKTELLLSHAGGSECEIHTSRSSGNRTDGNPQ